MKKLSDISPSLQAQMKAAGWPNGTPITTGNIEAALSKTMADGSPLCKRSLYDGNALTWSVGYCNELSTKPIPRMDFIVYETGSSYPDTLALFWINHH